MEIQHHLIVPALYLFRFQKSRQFPYVYVAPMLTSIRITVVGEKVSYTLLGRETSHYATTPLSCYGTLSERSPIYFEKTYNPNAQPELKRGFYDAFIVNPEESNLPGHLEESISKFKFDYFSPTRIIPLAEFVRSEISEEHSNTKKALFMKCIEEEFGWLV